MSLQTMKEVIAVSALASPRRRIEVHKVSDEELRDKRSTLLDSVGFETWEALFDKIELGNYTEEERIASEQIDSINWLLEK